MEMYYDGALVMPSSYALMDEDEMSYVEGGGTVSLTLKIGSNSFVIHALSAISGALTVAKCTKALTACELAIAGAIELGTAGTGSLYAGAFLLCCSSVIPSIAYAAVTYGIQGLKGKTFNCSVSKSWLPNLSHKFTI